MLRLKPPHGWNAVTWELAIVTVGVLIALAAQQWASDWNEKRKARAAIAALGTELGDHYASSVEWRAVHPCLVAQIEQLQRRLASSGERLEPAPVYQEAEFNTFVLRMPSKDYSSSGWEAAIADGVTSNLAPELRRELSEHYEQVSQVRALTERNNESVNGLMSLSRPLPLDPSARLALVRQLDELRGRVDYMDLSAGQMIYHVIQADMVPPRRAITELLRLSGTRIFCSDHKLPLRTVEQAVTPVDYKYTPATRPGPARP
jgi:hypothetical protein